jgi:hypothetical protein
VLAPHELRGKVIDLAGNNELPGLLEERERLAQDDR